jgi:hypothetical protein
MLLKSFEMHLEARIAYVILFIVLHSHAGAQSLTLKRGEKSRVIMIHDELTLFTEKRGVRNDSIEMVLRGELLDVRNDSLYMAYDEYAVHNYYKDAADSMHYVDEIIRDTMLFMKIPVNELTGIYKHRKKLTKAMTRIVFITLGTSLATIPLVLALEPGSTRDLVSAVNLTSASVMLVAAATGIIFQKKKFWIQPKTKGSWTIVR